MGKFCSELRRRSVFKIIIAYLIVGWLLIQAAEALLRSAIARQNGFAFAHIVLGMLLAATERLDEDRREMQKACDLQPESTRETVADVLIWSASSGELGSYIVHLLGKTWPAGGTQ